MSMSEEQEKNGVFWKAKPPTSVAYMNLAVLGFVPRNGFALSKHSKRKGVANVTQTSKKCGERSRVLQDKHLASGV